MELDLSWRETPGIDGIRDRVYGTTHVAGTPQFLLNDSLLERGLDQVFAVFEENLGGYYCSGIGRILQRVYQTQGIESYLLSHGVVGKFTHAIVLVPKDGKLIVQDPYLNHTLVWADQSYADYFDICRRALDGDFPQVRYGQTPDRLVHIEDPSYDGWIGSSGGRGICRKIDHRHHVLDVAMSVDDMGYHEGYKALMDWFSDRGLPCHPCISLLFPYAIVVGRKLHKLENPAAQSGDWLSGCRGLAELIDWPEFVE